MPDHLPESQEEILAACEASLTEADIPPEDEAFGWPDPDCGMPAELLALSDAELDELLEAIPARPAPLAWPLSYRTPDCLVSLPDPADPLCPSSPGSLYTGNGCGSAGNGSAGNGPPGNGTTRSGTTRSGTTANEVAESGTPGNGTPGNRTTRSGTTGNEVAGNGPPGNEVAGALLGGFVLGDAAGLAAGVAQGGVLGDVGGLEAGFAQGGVLDELPAGIVLAGLAEDAYARIAELDDNAQIGVLRAWRRLTSWAQAREFAMVTELARRRPAPGTPPAAGPGELPPQLSEFIAEEAGLALTLTRMAAQNELDLALDLASRPAIAAALETGRIDLPRTRILLSVICPLEPAHADAVEAAVLPRAEDLTTGQLRAALQRAVLAVDPDAARRRCEEAQKNARVEHWTDPEGTATLAGRYLPPAEVLAADKRLGAIATAWKKQGAQGGMDLLRAHAYLALLLGQPTDTPPPGLLPPAGTPAPASRTSTRSGASALPPLTGSVHLTIPLRTLLDLADAPGEAAGYGPLHADTCRTLTDAMASHPATKWGVIITDDTGRAMACGGPATARRTTPAGKAAVPGGARGSSTADKPAVPDGAQGSPTADKARGSPTTGRADDPPPPDGPPTTGRTPSPRTPGGPNGPPTASRTYAPPTGRAGGWTITLTTEPIAPYQ